MLKSIEFIQDWRCFKQGDKIEFKPGLNLLTGDQGCGKSSLLTMLQSDGYELQKRVAIVDAPAGTTTFFLDFEKGAVRSMDINVATSKGIAIQAVMANMFASHGEKRKCNT